jgi:outer membrane lipase/esterase
MLHSLLRLCALAAAVACTALPAHAQSPYSRLYVFGDSLTDSGNALFVTTHVVPFVPEIPAPPYFQGRFSNGYNFADDLNLKLFGKPLSPSFQGGTDFAVGGATTGTANNAAPIPTGMRVQTDTFLKTLGTRSADPNALYLVYGGANDIFAAVDDVRNRRGDPTLIRTATVNDAMGNLHEIIGELADRGAKHFLVPNLPDMGRIPSLVDSPESSFASQASANFNASLSALLGGLHGLDVHTMDVHTAFNDALAGKLGFADTTTPCYDGGIQGGIPPVPCANPNAHVFWDDIHPSARTHVLLGDLAFAAAVPEPGAWLAMLLGLVLLALLRLRSPASAAAATYPSDCGR